MTDRHIFLSNLTSTEILAKFTALSKQYDYMESRYQNNTENLPTKTYVKSTYPKGKHIKLKHVQNKNKLKTKHQLINQYKNTQIAKTQHKKIDRAEYQYKINEKKKRVKKQMVETVSQPVNTSFVPIKFNSKTDTLCSAELYSGDNHLWRMGLMFHYCNYISQIFVVPNVYKYFYNFWDRITPTLYVFQ